MTSVARLDGRRRAIVTTSEGEKGSMVNSAAAR
jgi:hypothetical protein